MKALFIVQGEGRGHMTQALALEQIMTESGNTVTCIAIGTCTRREVPEYFKKKARAPIHAFTSPNFYYDKSKKSIHLSKTVLFNLIAIPKFIKELRHIHALVKTYEPDIIVNFYDILGGLYFSLFKPKVRRICIAHQYLAYHNEFPFSKGQNVQKAYFKLTNFFTSNGSHKKIALSFQPYSNTCQKLTISPPLLREEIFALQPVNGDYILAYVVNSGYANEIMQWHEQNKKIKVHCFWDNKDQNDEWSPWKNLTFHHIDDQKFLTYMENCLGYVSTAGFESICEAMYLGKPVMMIPVKNQYEQACNALDAVKSGAGITSNQFLLSRFLNYISTHEPHNQISFKKWVDSSGELILEELELEFYKTSNPRKFSSIELNNRIRFFLSRN